jgi:hypothetical protein
MKNFLLLAFTCLIILSAAGQDRNKPVCNADLYYLSKDRPWKQPLKESGSLPVKRLNSSAFRQNTLSESTIGETTYDLQTSGSTASRVYFYPDGTQGSVWMYGIATPDFGDRGTAYNFFDGSSWGAYPTSRIETVKTGYPSYTPYGANGEATLAHDFSTPGGLVLCKRSQKGSGTWSQTTIPGPTGQNGLAWPRLVSSGNSHQFLHTIAITRPTSYAGGSIYQGLDGAILYSRSSDGGTSWNISNSMLPGMTSAEYNGFESNCYAFADPVGNTIAFVVGDTWTDLFLMKSNDNGDTWTKTVIFQHPYPKFEESHHLVTDTPWVCDGGVAVTLDEQGKAHVAFGLMRVLNSDTTDENTSYFPYTDGLVYWNEDKPAFQNLNFDTLWNHGDLVGYLQDMNNNDTVMEFLGIGIYYLSLTSMPTILVKNINNAQTVVLCFTSVMENLNNGNENYRHIWIRSSEDGEEWTDFHDLTGSIIHNFDECVFPFLSPQIENNNIIHWVYQKDEDPGMAVWGSDPPDPYTNNYIVAATYMIPHIDTLGIIDSGKQSFLDAQLRPNPASQSVEIYIESQFAASVDIEIRNLLGQIVYVFPHFKVSEGAGCYKLDVSSFDNGLYFYTLSAGTSSITSKFIVQH